MRNTPIKRGRQWPDLSKPRTPIARNAWLNSGRTTGIGSGLHVVKVEAASPPVRKRTPAKAATFSTAVRELLTIRDPWCVICGNPNDLHCHHRRLKGQGGDRRPHAHCACNGIRLCWKHHGDVHTGMPREDAGAAGYIVSQAVLLPAAVSAMVGGPDGGATLYPTCDGRWVSCAPKEGEAA